MFRFIILPWICLVTSCARPLDIILKDAGPIVERVLASPEEYEIQIVYVQVHRDKSNQPHFKEYRLREDPEQYFYPASTVKLPVAVLALEKLHEFNIAGLDRNTRMRIDSVRAPQTALLIDSTSESGFPSIGHLIHQIFLVSDNNAHNRLYEFMGQDELHAQLREHGLRKTRILHRLSAPQFSPQDNRYTNPFSFYQADTLIFQQPERVATEYNDDVSITNQQKGIGYLDGNENLIKQPFDFSKRNFYPLNEQIQVLKAIMFPQSLPEEAQFCLRPEDYSFLQKEMSLLPRESRYPVYDTAVYYDSYGKFFLFGDSKEVIPSHIRIFNKVGWAYGYMTDCAYIVDFENGVEFILAATILVNEDQIFNDEHYEFETVGLPFLAELGRAVYHYELQRPRKYKPDLSKLQILFPGNVN